MNWNIPLTEPDLGREEIDAVAEVLRGKWLTMGEVTAEFERQFASRMNVKHAFAVSNCTAALHIANIALGIGPGDGVICPALTFVASANASRYTNATVVFADVVSRHELTISPDDIALRITPRTKAITVVHYAGFTCKMREILDLATRHGLCVIEDCAHAPFARYRFPDGRTEYAGAIGDIGCFSFFGNKNMTTGEGGMITTNSDELADRIRLLRSHGMTRPNYATHAGHSTKYDVVNLGYNYRLDELRSAIGIAQLSKIDGLNARRRHVYRAYLEAFGTEGPVTVPFRHRDLEDASCHILPVLISGGAERAQVALQSHRIQTSRHYELIPSLSLYRDTGFRSILRADELLTLPLSPFMTEEQVQWIARIVLDEVKVDGIPASIMAAEASP